MKLKVTKTLANTLNKATKYCTITTTKLTPQQYSILVDIYPFNHDNDYDIITNTYKVMVIEYPPHYYANNQYITTNDLVKIYKMSDKTLNGFIKAFNNYIEI